MIPAGQALNGVSFLNEFNLLEIPASPAFVDVL